MIQVITINRDRVIALPGAGPVAFGSERWIITQTFGRPELPTVVWQELWSGMRIRTLFTEKDVRIALPAGCAIAYIEDMISAFETAGYNVAARALGELYKEGSLYIFTEGEYTYENPLPRC